MKIALYIEDGLEQLAITPENVTEQKILGKLHDGTRELSIKRGSFYETRGGYIRHSINLGGQLPTSDNDDSTMIVLRPAKPKTMTVKEIIDLAREMGLGQCIRDDIA